MIPLLTTNSLKTPRLLLVPFLSATLDAFLMCLNPRSMITFSKLGLRIRLSLSESPGLSRACMPTWELFYMVFGWLFEHHPRTAISNLPPSCRVCMQLLRKVQNDGNACPINSLYRRMTLSSNPCSHCKEVAAAKVSCYLRSCRQAVCTPPHQR